MPGAPVARFMGQHIGQRVRAQARALRQIDRRTQKARQHGRIQPGHGVDAHAPAEGGAAGVRKRFVRKRHPPTAQTAHGRPIGSQARGQAQRRADQPDGPGKPGPGAERPRRGGGRRNGHSLTGPGGRRLLCAAAFCRGGGERRLPDGGRGERDGQRRGPVLHRHREADRQRKADGKDQPGQPEEPCGQRGTRKMPQYQQRRDERACPGQHAQHSVKQVIQHRARPPFAAVLSALPIRCR